MYPPDQIRLFTAICRELSRQGIVQPITTETANAILDAANMIVKAFTPKTYEEGKHG